MTIYHKFLRLTILFSLLTMFCFGQSTAHTKVKYHYLKTWGFLKYYHPALASGRMDADSIFLSYFAAADKAGDAKQLDAVLSKMISSLNAGQTFRPAPTQYTATEMTQNVDQNWFTKSTFLKADVRNKLRYIYQHRSLH